MSISFSKFILHSKSLCLSAQVGFIEASGVQPTIAFEAQQPKCSYDSSCPELFLVTVLTGQFPIAIVKSIGLHTVN
jgi:hypothetical protein